MPADDDPRAQLPEAFMDLFEKRALGHLATVMADGTPHVTPVWVDTDGNSVLVNSAEGRVKVKNMQDRPVAGIEILDPDNVQRYLSVRGRVIKMDAGDEAEAHIHKLARRYTDFDRYPDEWRGPGEQRVLFRIEPSHVFGFDPFAQG